MWCTLLYSQIPWKVGCRLGVVYQLNRTSPDVSFQTEWDFSREFKKSCGFPGTNGCYRTLSLWDELRDWTWQMKKCNLPTPGGARPLSELDVANTGRGLMNQVVALLPDHIVNTVNKCLPGWRMSLKDGQNRRERKERNCLLRARIKTAPLGVAIIILVIISKFSLYYLIYYTT